MGSEHTCSSSRRSLTHSCTLPIGTSSPPPTPPPPIRLYANQDAAPDTAAPDTTAATAAEEAAEGGFDGEGGGDTDGGDGSVTFPEVALDEAAEAAANTNKDQRWLFDKKNSASMLTSYKLRLIILRTDRLVLESWVPPGNKQAAEEVRGRRYLWFPLCFAIPDSGFLTLDPRAIEHLFELSFPDPAPLPSFPLPSPSLPPPIPLPNFSPSHPCSSLRTRRPAFPKNR